MSKKKQQKDQAPKKRRVTPRQLMTGWIIAVATGTGAWYALSAMPGAQTIQQLQNDLRRAETRLEDNRERVAELETEIADLETQAAELEVEYAAFAPYVAELTAAAQYGENLAVALADAGLEVTEVEAPTGWEAGAGAYRTAQFTLDATGTYDAITTALTSLEEQPGISVRELQIVKNGGDPNDPNLITRLTLHAHAKAN